MKCGRCLHEITGPKLVINGWWRCADCTYREEIKEPDPRKRHRKVKLQEETLF